MQALTVLNVRSAITAALRSGPLPMGKLFAAVLQQLDVSERDEAKLA